MHVKKNNLKVSAHPELATLLLQMLIPTSLDSLLDKKGQFTLQPSHSRWFVWNIFDYYLLKMSKRQALQVLTKSL